MAEKVRLVVDNDSDTENEYVIAVNREEVECLIRHHATSLYDYGIRGLPTSPLDAVDKASRIQDLAWLLDAMVKEKKPGNNGDQEGDTTPHTH